MKENIRPLSLLLSMVLTAAMALTLASCGGETPPPLSGVYESGAVLGEGDTSFPFTVTAPDGREASFEVRTDAATVGDALLDAGIIAGDVGEYGLYVKTVNGITADYDTDGIYWAFYIDGEYAMTGVDATHITPGSVYSFKAEQ